MFLIVKTVRLTGLGTFFLRSIKVPLPWIRIRMKSFEPRIKQWIAHFALSSTSPAFLQKLFKRCVITKLYDIFSTREVQSGVAERAKTWGGHFWIFIYNAFSAALRATSLALIRRCISGSQYNDKLTINDLTSSSTRLSTFIIHNSSLNSGLRQVLPVRQYLGQFIQPAAGENFKDSVLKMVARKQFGNGHSHGKSLD